MNHPSFLGVRAWRMSIAFKVISLRPGWSRASLPSPVGLFSRPLRLSGKTCNAYVRVATQISVKRYSHITVDPFGQVANREDSKSLLLGVESLQLGVVVGNLIARVLESLVEIGSVGRSFASDELFGSSSSLDVIRHLPYKKKCNKTHPKITSGCLQPVGQ